MLYEILHVFIILEQNTLMGLFNGGSQMQSVRVIVSNQHKVVRSGVALILNSAQNLELIGGEGADVLIEACKLQPDLLVYELTSTGDEEYEILSKLNQLCNWTKIIIFSTEPFGKEDLKRFFCFCSGYLQGPILPGFLLKAVELACYSGHFFFLGSSKDRKPELKDEMQQVLSVGLSVKN